MNVLLVNNYSMERAYNLWSKGLSGSHHVWGKVELDRNSEVNMIVFPHEKYKWINSLGGFFGITHLDQQVRILFHLKSFDILYAPYFLSNIKFLLFLKFLGVFKKPIVVTIHQPFGIAYQNNFMAKRISRWILNNLDAAVFLSSPLKDKILKNLNLEKDSNSESFSTAQWGPDIDYYEKFCLTRLPFSSCDYFISAGHTDRDFELLIEAFRDLPYRLKIFCTPTTIPKTTVIPPNVEIDWEITFSKDLIPFYQKSIAILIPMKFPPEKEGCQGMTSIQDVLTFGKPTIVTTNSCLNVDVEKEGFGFNVDMHDVNGWKEKLEILATNSEIWESMSKNATQVFRNKVNSELFANHLEKVFVRVYGNQKKIS